MKAFAAIIIASWQCLVYGALGVPELEDAGQIKERDMPAVRQATLSWMFKSAAHLPERRSLRDEHALPASQTLSHLLSHHANGAAHLPELEGNTAIVIPTLTQDKSGEAPAELQGTADTAATLTQSLTQPESRAGSNGAHAASAAATQSRTYRMRRRKSWAARRMAYADTPDPFCTAGILTGTKRCCHPLCTKCGDTDCANDDYGPENCCADVIAKNYLSCTKHAAPCTVDPTLPIVVDPATIQRATVVGAHPGQSWNSSVSAGETLLSMKLDAVQLFMSEGALPAGAATVINNLKAGRNVQLTIELNGSHDDILYTKNAYYKRQLQSFGNKVKTGMSDPNNNINNVKLTCRLLHEMNGNWYKWGLFAGYNNTIPKFQLAFKFIVTTLRSTGAQITYQMDYASSSYGGALPIKSYFVGLENYVDEVCVAAYNMCGIAYSQYKPLNQIMDTWYKQITYLTNKPLCIAEMSSTDKCNPPDGTDDGKVQWIKDSYKRLASTYTQVTTVNWFFENKWNRDWDIGSPLLRDAFVNGTYLFKNITTYGA